MSRTAVQGEDKFASFTISTHTYKTVNEHPILADIFVPKAVLEADLSSEKLSTKRPLIIRIHGGALVGGQRDYALWCTGWLLSLALQHNAIIVAPDYRLLPESTLVELLEDLDDFMIWVDNELPTVVKESTRRGDKCLEVDLQRTVIAGDSAGGYCAIQMALSHSMESRHSASFSNLKLRALVAVYPMLNLRSAHWNKSYPKHIMGTSPVPESVIDEHLDVVRATTGRRPIVTNACMNGTPRGMLGLALIQHGRLGEFYGDEEGRRSRNIHPEDSIKEGAKLPPTLFVHGKDDSLVPVEFMDEFVELARASNAFETRDGDDGGGFSESLIMYARVDGEHGFDYDLDPGTKWIKDGLDFVQKAWLM